MGSRGRDRYGKAGREAAAAVDAIAALVDRFDPGLTGARDAFDLVAEFSRLEHLASAGVALAARRVAQTDLWKRGGHRSAAHWLAHVTGMGVGDAVRLLQTAETVEAAPDTREALRAGAVSVRQAKAIGAAEAVDPGAGQRLLAVAADRSMKETEDDAARVVRAASTETDAERAERHRRQRKVFHGVNADGVGWGRWQLPIAEHIRFIAQLEGEQTRVFAEAKTDGEREPQEAYAADAFCRIVDRAARVARVLSDEGVTAVVCDDAEGIYGHPDHRHCHAVAVAAAARTGVDCVYEVTVDREHLHFVETHLVATASDALAESAPGSPAVFGRSTVEIDLVVDVGAALPAKRAAFAAHASQLPAGSPVMVLDDDSFRAVYGLEWFCRRGGRGPIDDLVG
jgi:LmbE family N-acetylglucosaminyl deacetylase